VIRRAVEMATLGVKKRKSSYRREVESDKLSTCGTGGNAKREKNMKTIPVRFPQETKNK